MIFASSSLLLGMIEIDVLKDCVFPKDWETTNYAAWLSWLEEHVFARRERIKNNKAKKNGESPGECC